jgi:signal transduction histidine kinase
MSLSVFITKNLDVILEEWDSFARRMVPAAQGMTDLGLRDHAKQILQAIAADIDTAQSAAEQFQKSIGGADPPEEEESAASIHGSLRHDSEFSMLQLTAEFRALRATVLRLWLPEVTRVVDAVDDMVRFNEAIDQALAESVVSFSARTESARDMFLAVLGHDLRAPLASMAAAGHVLRHPKLDHELVQDLGERVSRGASLMSSMVEDLADYTRTQLGSGVPVAKQHLDLREICTWSVENASSTYPSTRFEFDVDGDGALDGLFDGVRLHRLFTNLLVNGAQHGTRGSPVTMDARAEAGEVVVRVTNQGPVIPKQALKTIFKPLVQLSVDDRNPSPTTSMGLGLFIAREIAAAHGGGVSVVSGEDGTTFTVRLPRGDSARRA